jgi:spermidine synthase
MNAQPNRFEACFSPTAVLQLEVHERVFEAHSPFQKISVFDTPDFGRVLALDDVINVTERDEFIYHEMLIHPALFIHPEPKRVCVVGGGDGGAVREIMKHPDIDSVLLVEIDRMVVETARAYLPAVSCALNDSRLEIRYEDAAACIAGRHADFDVIAVDSTDPVGPGERLFTRDFYTACRRALRPGGMLTAQSESPFFDPAIVERLYTNARTAFNHVWMYTAIMPSYVSGMWSFMLCSTGPDPLFDFDPHRVHAAGLELGYYSAEMHLACFALPPCIKEQFAHVLS